MKPLHAGRKLFLVFLYLVLFSAVVFSQDSTSTQHRTVTRPLKNDTALTNAYFIANYLSVVKTNSYKMTDSLRNKLLGSIISYANTEDQDSVIDVFKKTLDLLFKKYPALYEIADSL